MSESKLLNAAISAVESGVSLASIEGLARETPKPTPNRLQYIAHSALTVHTRLATTQQAQFLDKLIVRKRIPYSTVMQLCCQQAGRKIRTFGEMYYTHMEEVIKEVKKMQYRDMTGKEYA